VLQGYKGFLCLLHAANNGVVTLTSHPGLRNAAVVFTAPDCLDAFLARVSPEQRPGLRTESIYFTDCEPLRTEWPDIDGVVLNPVGPGPVAVFGL